MRPDVAVFDLDDTLYPELAFARSGLVAVSKHLAAKWKLPDTSAELIAILDSGCRHKIFDELLPRYNLPTSIIPDLVKVYRNHTPAISLEASTEHVLSVLKEAGIVTAVLSDGPLQLQQNKIEALGVDALVDHIVLTDVGNGSQTWKPSPWGYEELERRLGNLRYVYVGDNVEKDFVTARRLGWHTVELRRADRMYVRQSAGPEYEAHEAIGDLTELLGRWGL